jgi:hypothetical protein
MILRIFLSIPQFRNSWFALMSYLLKMPLESDSWAFGDSDFAYAPHCWGIMVITRSWRFDCIGVFSSFEAKYLVESEKEYPFSFNGKCVLPLLCLWI